MINVRAYAKINLALEVMGESNGYHGVNNIMIPISVFDELSLEKSYRDNVYVLDGYIQDNIVEKALKLFKEKYCIEQGCEIQITKHIPAEAGLAGGSTDAAAALIGLCELFNIRPAEGELEEIASKLGSDVPFFLTLQTSMCTGRGEIITPYDFETPYISLLLVKPDTKLSTKKVYKHYEYDGSNKADKIKAVEEALRANDVDALEKATFNDLENVALKINKDLKALYDELVRAGLKPHVTGSGPTMFILNPSKEQINKVKELINDKCYLALCHTK